MGRSSVLKAFGEKIFKKMYIISSNKPYAFNFWKINSTFILIKNNLKLNNGIFISQNEIFF